MASSHLKVIRIMGRGDLHAARAEFFIHIFVCNHRNLPIRQRKLQHFSDQILIALISGIHRDRRIAQHRFRACGGNLHKTALFSDDRVLDMPEKAVLFLMLHLCVRDRGLTGRTPVDDPRAFIDIALFIQLFKDLQHGFGAALIHRKAHLVPVRG